jgi:hypothetical protein
MCLVMKMEVPVGYLCIPAPALAGITHQCVPQADYPVVVEKIKEWLLALHSAGVPLTVLTAHGVMVATIIREEPAILE